MVEYLLLAQLVTSKPIQPPVPPPSQYQAPSWQQYGQTTPSGDSTPSSKRIEESEESLFDHPN